MPGLSETHERVLQGSGGAVKLSALVIVVGVVHALLNDREGITDGAVPLLNGIADAFGFAHGVVPPQPTHAKSRQRIKVVTHAPNMNAPMRLGYLTSVAPARLRVVSSRS